MISIIMSTYNENISELQLSIRSILYQTITDFELIIIDDNPNYLNLRLYLLDVKRKDQRIKVYFNNKNLGAAKARNIGIKYSLGEFIAIMDADDISKSNRLEKQLNFLKNNDLDFVFSNFERIRSDNEITKPVYNFNSIVNKAYIKYLFAYYKNISLQSSWFVKREVFFKLRGYRDIIIEDYDFNVRAITYGYKLGYQKDSLVIKRERNNNISSYNSLQQYITLKTIQGFIKKDKYNNIILLNNIKRHVTPFITKKEINKFRIFFKAGIGIKHNDNFIKNITILLYSLFSSKIVLGFICNLFIIKIMTLKLKFL